MQLKYSAIFNISIHCNLFSFRQCRRSCRKTMRIRADTFFECWQEITLAHLIHGIYLWSHGILVSHLERHVNLTRKVAMKLCQKLRACCSSWLTRNPITIGGNGVNYVVQIEEPQFHHRQRVSMKKYLILYFDICFSVFWNILIKHPLCDEDPLISVT